MKIALVHDDLIQNGGAERLVRALHEIWPEAPLYTSFAGREWVKKCQDLRINLRTSFMQQLPFKKQLYKLYFLFFPLAFESFNFDEFDIVVSSSARFAHGIITKPKTTHVCYMNTPARMWWDSASYFGAKSFLRFILSPVLSFLRLWDFAAAQRVDFFIANSKTPQARIKKYYGREAEVVYPFADLSRHPERLVNPPAGEAGDLDSSTRFRECQNDVGKYFLVVTRLSSWKRVDIAVEACKELGLSLVVVGRGPDLNRLKKLARGSNLIKFFDKVEDEELVKLYEGSRAVIITQEEDFGIVCLEAAGFEKPVIAFRGGGSLEIIKEGATGEFFYPQTKEALKDVLANFDSSKYRNHASYNNAQEEFSKRKFRESIKNTVKRIYNLHPS